MSRLSIFILGTVALFVSTSALADVKQIKIYKQVFPDAKPKCVSCHLDEKPSKDEGKHELNDYGKAAKELAAKQQTEEATPTDATYKELGAIENFKK